MKETLDPGEVPFEIEEDRRRRLAAEALQKSAKLLEIASAGVPAVGLTPKDVLLERGTLRLYHYRPKTDEVYRVPVLIVMATTNKGFLFDLMPGQSMVECLVRRGFDVYMIDWAEPRPEERGLTLAHYTQDFIPSCIDRVREDSGVDDVSLVGYCQGGVLALIYAATHVGGPLKNLVLFTTPIDQHQMGLARIWADPRFHDVDALVDFYGVIPESIIKGFFEMLRPAGRRAGQMRLWDHALDQAYVSSFAVLERWGNETLPLAGEYFRETTKKLLWRNELYKGELVVAGKRVELGAITVPVLHAVAQHDHIVPYAASRPLLEMLGSTDKHEILLKGGHVSLVAGPRAKRRLWPAVDRFLSHRSV